MSDQLINPTALAGKVALVTGGSRGIGAAICIAMAKAGADIVVAATQVENTQTVVEAVQGMGRRALGVGCRVEKESDVESLLDMATDAMGKVDILVNNAGIAMVKPILEMTGEDWEHVQAVNTHGVFHCARHFAIRLKQSGGKGAIINIGSIAGQNAFPNRSAYCSSKAAVHHMTRVLAVEWAEIGIRVNCIAPGYIRTDILESLQAAGKLDVGALEKRIPQGLIGEVEDIASAAVYLASDSAKYITGSVLNVDGGWDAYGFL